MKNTRLVSIVQLNEDMMQLTLYYGNKKADRAEMSGVKDASHQQLLDVIEQFRKYGIQD